MGTALPVSPSSQLGILHQGKASDTSCSSVTSIASCETVRCNRLRTTSTSSFSSVGPCFIPSLQRCNSCTGPPSRSKSSVDLSWNKAQPELDGYSTNVSESGRASLTSAASLQGTSNDPAVTKPTHPNRNELLDNGNLSCSRSYNSESRASDAGSSSSLGAQPDASRRSFTKAFFEDQTPDPESPPFRRWVNKLRRKRQQYDRPPTVSVRKERWVLDDFDIQPSISPRLRRSRHYKSESQTSSINFVTAVKSATTTLASASIATFSKHTNNWHRGKQRSSLVSEQDARPSVESVRIVQDEAARQRSRRRREKLEELIRTEESYVADLRALLNAYWTVLGRQGPAQKTITDLLHLHDEILGRLHALIPFSEYDQLTANAAVAISTGQRHTRWHSMDAMPQRLTPARSVRAVVRPGRRSLNMYQSSGDELDPKMLHCSPEIVAAVTSVFNCFVDRFAVYEEFGANYDLIQREIEEAQQAVANWKDFDRAIEALSVHVNPTRTHEENRNKAMTIRDLLIKPIQRIPRYELLFGDLCRFTPVCDDPNVHASLNRILVELNNACRQMNEAKENPVRARRLQTSWLLVERLNFSSQIPRSVYLKLLGQVQVCGCLHIAYRSRGYVKGRYVIVVLFQSTLLLASADDHQHRYKVLAGLALAHATIEETDNQKGLQCHTAPHSWKVVFEHAGRMYEFIFTACSATEAEVWRSQLGMSIDAQSKAVDDGKSNTFDLQSPLMPEVTSIGKAFGKPGSFVRRMSVHRTATIGPATDLNQVIIKNTQGVKEVHENSSQTSLQISRSQSVQTLSHVQTLQPRRAERQRLEGVLEDVWTKDLLPYPGMIRRSAPIRASANHVIRKFSMASITSNFSSSKRNPSHTSIASSRTEDSTHAKSTCRKHRRETRSMNPEQPALVNFHNAPDAFLPSDFELQDPSTKQKRSALRTLTLTMERPFSPLLGNNRSSDLQRAQSVRDTAAPQAAPRPASVPPERELQSQRGPTPVYSVVHKEPKVLGAPQVATKAATRDGRPPKTPRTSTSKRLLRLFG